MKNAVLITIGDEILSGNTIDTNSNFIATQLKNIGFKVVQIFTISDEIETIKKTLKSAFELGNLVITTGGLGPTKDDKTKKAFAEFFNDTLVSPKPSIIPVLVRFCPASFKYFKTSKLRSYFA